MQKVAMECPYDGCELVPMRGENAEGYHQCRNERITHRFALKQGDGDATVWVDLQTRRLFPGRHHQNY